MNRWRARLIWASALSTISIAGLFLFGKVIPAYAENLKANNVRPSALVKLAILISDFWQHNFFWLVPLIVLFWFGAVFISAILLELREQALKPIADAAARPNTKVD